MDNEAMCNLLEVLFNADETITSLVVRDKLVAVKTNVIDERGISRTVWVSPSAEEKAEYEANQ